MNKITHRIISIALTVILSMTFMSMASASSITSLDSVNEPLEIEDTGIEIFDAYQNELDMPNTEQGSSKRDRSIPQKVYNDVQIANNVARQQPPLTKDPTSRAPFANNPNSAYFLDPTLLNVWLSVLGDSNEDWFYFQGNANTRVTAVLNQPATGDYDIALYRLDQNTGTLTLVAYSIYAGSTTDQFSYVVTDNAYYFFRVIPITPANPSSDYIFALIISNTFDSAEPDDNFWQARHHSNASGFTVNQTIDNPFDSDWFSFSTGSRPICRVILSNIPSGATYGFILYDSNLNLLASFSASGSETRTWALSTNTTYYIKIFSVNGGFSATQSYRLAVQLHPNYSQSSFTPAGNLVGVFNNELYIDGNKVNLTGTLLATSSQSIPHPPNTWVSRQQSYAASGLQVLNIYGVGTYTGVKLSSPSYASINCSNAIIIDVTNVVSVFSYHQYVNGSLIDSGSLTIKIPDDFPVTYIAIDATTGAVIDFPEINWLYWGQGHTPGLNGHDFRRY